MEQTGFFLFVVYFFSASPPPPETGSFSIYLVTFVYSDLYCMQFQKRNVMLRLVECTV